MFPRFVLSGWLVWIPDKPKFGPDANCELWELKLEPLEIYSVERAIFP